MAEKKEPKSAKESTKASKAAAAKAPVAQEPVARVEQNSNENHYVFVGKKGAMAYVLAVTTQFGQGAKDVILKARGKSISSAVDVAEIVRHQYPQVKLTSIGIATEEVITEDGRPLRISSIEIVLSQ